MPTFRYRAATSSGAVRAGALEAATHGDVLQELRSLGLMPIEAVAMSGPGRGAAAPRSDGRSRRAVIDAIGELAVLLEAGLTLERALAVCMDNVAHPGARTGFEKLRARVKEGAPLSRAMSESPGLFPPMASAMGEAGEADGRLGGALARLAESLDRAETLRQTVISSLIYPAVLIVVATSVILVMLLIVVPQFEGLFAGARGKLPFATRMVMGASEAVRAHGWLAILVFVAAGMGLRAWLTRPSARLAFDRLVLKAPWLGAVITNAQTAAFARTLGSLVEGGVPLPVALGIARKSVSNSFMALAIGRIAADLKEGAGLTGPLAASGVFPPMALGFLRTGEETAQLGLMLRRLADVLDRGVRSTIQRMIGIMTPAITVIMGAAVATVIASIMSAILGFNDLALSP